MERVQEPAEVCAQSVEFVAVPGMAGRMQSTLPAAIRSAFQDLKGFAGCAGMVSDQEARLVTVVTFWKGKDRSKRAGANARWVEKMLDPYIDRLLRTQNLHAQIAMQPENQNHSCEAAEFASVGAEIYGPAMG
jgi:hypothetical protein